MKGTETREIIRKVYAALEKKGYRPIDQLIGYILSGDPTYITNCDGARQLIQKVEQDTLLEDILRTYFAEEQQGRG